MKLHQGWIVVCVAAALLCGPATLRAQSVPPGFVVENAFPTASFSAPVQVVFLPDGRKLVVELAGRVWVMTAAGIRLPTPFIDLNIEVLSGSGRGLLGVALDPDFATTRWVYLLYTVDPNADGSDGEDESFGRLTRYQVDAGNPNVLDLSTRQILIGPTWPEGVPALDSFHVIGTLRFAADKTLLVGCGDGAHFSQVDAGGIDPGGFGPGMTDPSEDIGSFRCLSLNSLAGKILRVDKETGGGLPSNPYWDGDPFSARSRVWLYGVRNPFRYAIRPGTGSTNPDDGDVGALYVADVGWLTTEEVTIATVGGLNLGWPCVEGPFLQPGYQAVVATAAGNTNVLCSAPLNPENPVAPTGPDVWWDHNVGADSNPVGWTGQSATGGVFYTGTSYPTLYQDSYFVADFTSNWIRTVQVDASNNVLGTTDFMTGAGGPVDIEADPISGDIYYIAYNNSEIRRIRYVAAPPSEIVRLRADDATGGGPPTIPGAGSPWTDLLNGHDGTLVNFGGTALSGWQGDGTVSDPYRLKLDGVDDRVTIPGGSVPELQGPLGYSLTMWFNTGADVSGNRYLVEWLQEFSSPYSGMTLGYASGQLRLWQGTFWGNIAPVAANTWYHVAVAKQGGLVEVYLNGALAYSNAAANIGSQLSEIVIGAGTFPGAGSYTTFHDGSIAQLSIFEGALDEASIVAAFEADEHLYVPAAALPTGLVQLQADLADGAGPYPVPGAASPWVDLIGPHDAALAGFSGTAGSGWAGDGSNAAPHVLAFDGSDDRVTIAADSVPQLQSTLSSSIELWLRTGPDVTAAQYLIEWLDTFASPYSGMTVGISNGNLEVFLNPWQTIAAVQPSTWYHIVVTKRAGQVRVYLDGDLAFDGTSDNLGNQNSEIVIGASTFRGAGVYGEYFGGSIARVTLFGGTLRADGVRDLYLQVQPDGALGGALFDRFWASETGFEGPQDPTVDLADITEFPQFYRCSSCHGWDRKGRFGALVGRGPDIDQPNAAPFDLNVSVAIRTDQELFDVIKNVGGRPVDPALTADGTSGLGDPMPDFSTILSDGEIWSIVEFLRSEAVDTEQLYDLSTTGSYPNGTAEFLNIGASGDDVAGNTFFQANCSNCHGATGLLFPGISNPSESVGSIVRSVPDRVQHVLKFGNLGTSMLSFPDISVGQLQDLYALMGDPVQFPDPPLVGDKFLELRADQATGTGPHPVPGAASPWVDLAAGYSAVLNNFGGTAVSGWQGAGTSAAPYRLEFDGSNDYVSIAGGSIPELQSATAYSLGMWFRTGPDVSTARYLIEWVAEQPAGTPWSGMTVRIAGGNLDLWRGPGNGGFGTFFSGVQPNTWYHLVVTKQSGLAETYVNGTAAGVFATPNIGDQNSAIIIGGGIFNNNPPESVPWLGAIAQVTLYTGALDAGLALSEFEADEATYFPTGACCDGATGICTDDVLASDCQEQIASWTAGTACADVVPACADQMVFVFEDGFAGYAGTHDTYLQEGDPVAINGALDVFEWDGLESSSNAPTYALLRFDDLFSTTGGPIQTGATVLSATLTYTIPLSGDQSPAGDAGTIHRVAPGVTWDEASVNYGNFGGDAGIQPDEYLAASATAPGGPLGPISVDVTADVAAWSIAPGNNHGWLILPTADDGTVVSSSESPGEASERPRLTIIAAQSTMCTVPADCDDANVCNGAEDCVGGTCVAGTPLDCNDGDSCTIDTCDAVTGCDNTAIDCDDGVVCTTDSCDLLLGCINVDNCPVGLACNYGTGACAAVDDLPIVAGDDWQYFKGTGEPSPLDLTAWTNLTYNDGAWLSGSSSFGYGSDCPPFGTLLDDMQNGYRSVYMRRLFNVNDPAAVTQMTLTLDYDDAFVAYINGVEVARNNVPGAPPTYDQLATADHECSGSPLVANPPEDVDIAAGFDLSTLLDAGANVLAIQGHNLSDGSSDFTILATMTSVEESTAPLPPTVSAVGSRYLAVTPPPGHASVALRVESTALPCVSQYVDATGLLVDDPVFQSSAAWSTVSVGDLEIIPSTTYEVRADARLPAEPSNLSAPTSATTWRWGDGDDDGIVNITDIVCGLDGFRDVFNVCQLEGVDLDGALEEFLPDRNIDIIDIVDTLDAFAGVDYPGPLPCVPPAPEPPGLPRVSADVILVPVDDVVRPGGTIEVDVYASRLSGLRAYQLQLEVTGGQRGEVRIAGLRIDADREDYVFNSLTDFAFVDAGRGRLASALLSDGVHSKDALYLGTFELRASTGAAGAFTVHLAPATMLIDASGQPIHVKTATRTDIAVSFLRKR